MSTTHVRHLKASPKTVKISETQCPPHLPLLQRQHLMLQALLQAGFDLQKPFSYDVVGELTILRQ